ncbi:MAG: glycosyltransferase family 4 protein, partial [Planctomycetaceae bacterium]|nr:glycosyltransferase family 4 protein [Planctomycetaceae bacterium]
QITVIPLAANDCFTVCYDKSKIENVLKKYHVINDSKYIFSVASIDTRKNVDLVLRAFDLLLNPKDSFGWQVPENLYLVLAGLDNGKDLNALHVFKNMPESTRQRIIFTGYVDDIDLPFLYNGARCFCFMSLYEGFGLPVLEAMQCGVPVITSNTSSLPEVVGNAGIMLDPHDVEGLANAFMRVVSDENLRNEMTAKGLEQAKKFSWERCTDLIVEKIIN